VKSPAVLFYTSDFLTGVSNLTMLERGQYITLLSLQHQSGHLSKKTIEINVGKVSKDVLKKFEKDQNNCYFNERMEQESEKREKYVKSRYTNGYKGGRPRKNNHKVKHMLVNMDNHIGNENENEDILGSNIDKELENYNWLEEGVK